MPAFTYYMNGKGKTVQIQVGDKEKAKYLESIGAKFYLEFMATGQIYLACELEPNEEDTLVLASIIAEDDDSVRQAVSILVDDAYNRANGIGNEFHKFLTPRN